MPIRLKDGDGDHARENIFSKTADEKKPEPFTTFQKTFLSVLGADTEIVSLLTNEQRKKLVVLGSQVLALFYMVVACGIYFLIQIYNVWNLILLLILFFIFTYLLFASLTLRLFQEWIYSSRTLWIMRVFVFAIGLFFLVIAYVGLNAGKIRSQLKRNVYEKENAVFIDIVNQINSNTKSLLSDSLDRIKKHNTYWVDQFTSPKIAAEILGYDKTKIKLARSKINTSYRDSSYNINRPDIYGDLVNDLRNDNFDFVQPIEKIFEIQGIRFANDSLGKIRILENYNDSLFLHQINYTIDNDIMLAIMEKNRGSAKYYDPYGSFTRFNDTLFSAFPAFSLMNEATQNWLGKLLAAENTKHSPMLWWTFSLKLLITGQSLFVLLVITLLFSWLFYSILNNLKSFQLSGYQDLYQLYNKSQSEKFEGVKQNLNTRVEIYSDITEDSLTPEMQKSLRDIGSPGFYLTSGDIYATKADYDKALDYYIGGYNQFKDPIFLDKAAKMFQALGNDYQYDQYREKYTLETNKKSHQNNLQNDIIVQNIELINHPFYGSMKWRLDSRMNILLGKNGYGKSHLLAILLSLLQNEKKKADELSPNQSLESEVKIYVSATQKFSLTDTQQKQLDSAKDIKEKEQLLNQMNMDNHSVTYSVKKGLESIACKIPVLAIPDTRFIDKSVTTIKSNTGMDFLEDSAHHFLYQKPYAEIIENALYKFCQNYLENKDSKPEVLKVVEKIFKTLTNENFSVHSIRSTDTAGYELLITTEGSDIPLPIQKVSQGTFSIISIVLVIYNYLRLRYKNVSEDQLLLQPAIVMIDELDAHLHPAWQQKSISIMHNTFPNVQFIITAHSPLVVAGCKEDEVSVMRKINKNFELHHFTQDFIGYLPEELYRIVFDIEAEDEVFARYNAMIPFESSIQNEITALEKLTTPLKPEQQQKLSALYEDLYYISKVKERMNTRLDAEKLKLENYMLRMEVDNLKNPTT